MEIDGKLLDENQEKIVREEASCQIISGAGAGKTLTIIAKVKDMIDQGINKNSILIIAYTRLSAKEVEERLAKVGISLRVYTFHSLSFKYNNIKRIITNEELNEFNTNFFLVKDERQKILNEIYHSSDDYKLAEQVYKRDLISLATVIRVNDYNLNRFMLLNRYDRLTKKILLLYLEEYEAYKNHLAVIDYDDMIKNAIGKVSKKYKYVIVDEFQDISLIRFNLLKSIIDNNKAKLYVFGDDYQAIYGFSGSKLVYFTEFSKYSGIKKQLFIKKTYRNSQELLDVCSSFVLKNKKQIKKDLVSDKHLAYPIEIIYYDYKKAFDYIFKLIDKNSSVLILSRYSFNERILLENGFSKIGGRLRYQDFTNINYLTVHKAKGLEADYVIILEMINDTYGFPSKVKTSSFLRKINDYKEMKYAEERRLFYVALTRTKNKVYLITKEKEESIFIKELSKYPQVKLVK